MGRYYGTPFKDHRGVTQGGPISPTIFNMVADALIPHWVMMVAAEDARPDGFGRAFQWLTAFFYADDSLLALPRLARLQAPLDVLTGFFDRVGLHTNVNKTVGTVCRTCYIVDGHSEAAYTRRMTGVVPSFRERQRERVQCPECELELTAGSLTAHRQAQHGKERPPQWATPHATPDPRLYNRVSFPRASRSIGCPVEVCEGRVTTRTNLRIHFVHRHMWNTIVILEEGNRPHPRCPSCDMFIPWAALNRRHPSSDLCTRGADRNRQCLAEEEARAGAATALRDYGQPL